MDLGRFLAQLELLVTKECGRQLSPSESSWPTASLPATAIR